MSIGGILAEPPSRSAVRDAVALAQPLLAAYRAEPGVVHMISQIGDATNVDLVVASDASTARAAGALFEMLQLALGAATAAAEYVEETGYAGGEIDLQLLEDLAARPVFELEIIELTTGSIRTRLRLIRTRDGRSKLLSVALLVSLALSPVISAVPSLVVTALIAANELTPDEKDAQIHRLQEELAQVQQELAAQDGVVVALHHRLEKLERMGQSDLDTVQATTVEFDIEIAA